jgi:sterol desaturase/sphingolipid hydroxylase (fatty acid hydroxylase superfamily)
MSASSFAAWIESALSGTTGLLALFAIFMAVGVAETLAPARPSSDLTARRWFGNLSLYTLTVVVPLLPAVAGVSSAVLFLVPHYSWLDRLTLPPWLHVVAGILLLDLVSYTSHRISHRVGFLWRLHAVHHSDPDVDVTTTLRHHPVEQFVVGLLTGSVIVVLGASALEVAAFSWLAVAVQLVAHGNLALPPRVEAVLGRIVVTPDFHRLHHSRLRHETDSNYGTIFPFWDMLLGTARSRSPQERDSLEFGLDAFPSGRSQQLRWMLIQPVLAQLG